MQLISSFLPVGTGVGGKACDGEWAGVVGTLRTQDGNAGDVVSSRKRSSAVNYMVFGNMSRRRREGQVRTRWRTYSK